MAATATHDHVDLKKHVRTYMLVFGSLMVLTLVTVGLKYLHLPTVPAILVALAIAMVKGSLVACYFMHLISERKLIYGVLILTVVFFIVLMSMPVSGHLGSTATGHTI
jgi:cytochrome c oxidase subunit 4